MDKTELTYVKTYAIIKYIWRCFKMTNVNITNFRKDIYELLEQTIKYNEPINISTKNGNAVVLSEEDYNNLMETIYIYSNPGLKEDIVKGLKEDIEDCVDEKKVEW